MHILTCMKTHACTHAYHTHTRALLKRGLPSHSCGQPCPLGPRPGGMAKPVWSDFVASGTPVQGQGHQVRPTLCWRLRAPGLPLHPFPRCGPPGIRGWVPKDPRPSGRQVGKSKEAGGCQCWRQGGGSWTTVWGQVGTARGRGLARPLSQALRISAVSFQIEFTPEQIEGEWAS